MIDIFNQLTEEGILYHDESNVAADNLLKKHRAEFINSRDCQEWTRNTRYLGPATCQLEWAFRWCFLVPCVSERYVPYVFHTHEMQVEVPTRIVVTRFFLQRLQRQQGLSSLTCVTSLPSFQITDVLARFPLIGLAISFASIYSWSSCQKWIRPSWGVCVTPSKLDARASHAGPATI